MRVYHSKKTREDDPSPELRWIIDENVQVIGFDAFEDQLRLSVARLDGECCNVTNKETIDFFTEVLSTSQLTSAVNDTNITIDVECSPGHLMIYTENFQYKGGKISVSESLEFRQRYLPIDQSIAKGYISSKNLYHCVNQSPGDELQIKITDDIINFISKSDTEKLQYSITDTGTVSSSSMDFECSLDCELLFKTIKKFPKDKLIQFFVTEEFVRFRYELGGFGYMNYYQRGKDSEDTYVP